MNLAVVALGALGVGRNLAVVALIMVVVVGRIVVVVGRIVVVAGGLVGRQDWSVADWRLKACIIFRSRDTPS